MKGLLSLVMLAAGCSSACGFSPILNHATASDGNPVPTADTQRRESLTCDFTFQAGLCAQLTWTKPADSDNTGTFQLQFFRGNERVGPEAGTVFVKLWMPSMGHGSSPVTTVVLTDNGAIGLFEARNVFFVMPGAWDIRVQLKNGTQLLDEATLAIQVP